MTAKVALIGCNGFVGTQLCHSLEKLIGVSVKRISRHNYFDAINGSYDILINSATPSRRYWAKKYPSEDFSATVSLTSDIINHWSYDKYVHISSISARSQLDTVYGRHKAAAEKLVDLSRSLIVRLGPMYGDGLTKGVLLDLLKNQKVFVSGSSKYCFTPVTWVADWISCNLFDYGLIEIGSKNFVTLEQVAKTLDSKSEFTDYVDDQIIQDPPDSAPEASEVLSYVLELKSN